MIHDANNGYIHLTTLMGARNSRSSACPALILSIFCPSFPPRGRPPAWGRPALVPPLSDRVSFDPCSAHWTGSATNSEQRWAEVEISGTHVWRVFQILLMDNMVRRLWTADCLVGLLERPLLVGDLAADIGIVVTGRVHDGRVRG